MANHTNLLITAIIICITRNQYIICQIIKRKNSINNRIKKKPSLKNKNLLKIVNLDKRSKNYRASSKTTVITPKTFLRDSEE